MILRRRLARGLLDAALLLSVLVVVLTGFFVDRLDLREFRLHAWSGYVMAALVAAHVVVHRRALLALMRPRLPRHVSERPAPPRTGPNALTRPEVAISRRRPSRRTVLASVATGAIGSIAGWVMRAEVAPNPYPGGDVGLFYHRESSLGVRGLLSNLLDWGTRPPRYKDQDAEHSIDLPSITTEPEMALSQAMRERRSRREFTDRAMTAEELAWMVRSATGITSDGGRRVTPSAGALYPIETYVAVNRVEDIDPGLYHVDVRAQALCPVRTGSVAGDLMVAGLGQDFLRTASVVFILSGYFQRTRWKYHERHYRYVCWEAGHIAQNLYLAGEAAHLGVCVVGAFFDGAVNDLLRLDGTEEAALGFVAVGPR